MSLQTLIQQYASFNLWANQKIVHRLQQESEELWYMETPSSFPSIDFTLQHILRTERFWYLFISDQSIEGFDWSVKDYLGEQIQQELLQQSSLLKEYALQVSEKDLGAMLELNMPWSKNKKARWEYFLHVINHGTYHRGQLITQLRMLGITENIPATDYNFYRSE